ncbi:MAG: hypothetical protein DRP65_06055 [Planctomycetota bacterium]|nr:MAG: hypothetical protein DRP65_06055 [Planctomycetota bacterium]
MNCENAFRIIVLIALLMGAVSCQEAEPVVAPVAGQIEPAEDILVSYGDKKLTMRHIEYMQPGADSRTIKRIADWWLSAQLLSDEAVKRGLDKDPAIRYRADLRVKQEYAEGLKKHVLNAVQVSEDQLRDFYDQNKETDRQINKPAKLSFTHVASKTLEESQAILERVKAGEDIGALAKELSIDYDKRKNGAVKDSMETNIGRRFGTEFLNAILQATEGNIIGPIKATLSMGKGERYEVVRVEGKVPGRIKSFDEVKDYIKTRLERVEKEKAVKDLLKSLKEKAGEIYRAERILKPEAPASRRPARRRMTTE